MPKTTKKYSWKKTKKLGETIFTMFSRLLLLLIVFGALQLLYKSINNDQLVIQSFQVPGKFDQNGNNGMVISRKVQDKVNEIKQFVASQKKDSIQFSDDFKPDLELGVMGVGLSLNTITYHLKTLFGKENKLISGELTDMDQRMELTLRMTGFEPQKYQKEYTDNRNVALDFLLEEAAKRIIHNTDPYRIAIYYYHKEEYQKATKILAKMIEDGRDEKWAYLAWGNLLSHRNKQTLASEKFKKAIAIDSKFAIAHQASAWNNFEQQKFEAAENCFLNWIDAAPKSAQAWNGIAFNYRRLDRQDKAREAYDKAIELEPETVWWYGNKADFLLNDLKDTIGAATLFRTVSEKIKDGTDKFMALAGFSLVMNEPDSLQFYIEQTLDIEPQHSIALTQGVKYHYQNKNFRKALMFKDKALLLEVSTKSERLYRIQGLLNYLAMCHYELQEYEESLEMVHKSIALDKESAYPYTTLAEIYALKGDTQKFYESLEIALAKGYDLMDLIEDAPYQPYIKQARFQKLLKEYKLKHELEAQLVKN